jgi:hypothetical protein
MLMAIVMGIATGTGSSSSPCPGDTSPPTHRGRQLLLSLGMIRNECLRRAEVKCPARVWNWTVGFRMGVSLVCLHCLSFDRRERVRLVQFGGCIEEQGHQRLG